MAKTYYDSPFGIARYPWVNKPDVKFNDDGLYKIGLILEGADAEKLRERVDREVEAAFNEKTADLTPGERKKWKTYVPYEVEEDDQGNPTGRVIFDFKQNAKIRLKSGEVKEVKIGLYDSTDKEMHKPVFGGSEVRVRYSFRAIAVAGTKQAGVRLDFSMVQVRKLSSGTGGRGFGSTVEDGYVEEDEGEAPSGFGTQAPATASSDY